MTDHLSRRKLLGRGAVVAGGVWAAPAITTIGGSAAAVTGPCPVAVPTGVYVNTVLTPPVNVPVTFRSNTQAFMFAEMGPLVHPVSGQVVCSYLAHCRPVAGGPLTNYVGSVSFGGLSIVRIITGTGALNASDATFGIPGVVYTIAARGTNEGGDSVFIPVGGTSVTFNPMRSLANFSDQCRILVACT